MERTDLSSLIPPDKVFGELERLFSGDGMQFAQKDLDAMSGPCVYVVQDCHDNVLYVGQSADGIDRITSKHHHARSRYSGDAHTVRLYPCRDKASAMQAEALLIHLLRPATNKVNIRQRLKAFVAQLATR